MNVVVLGGGFGVMIECEPGGSVFGRADGEVERVLGGVEEGASGEEEWGGEE